MAVPVSRRNLVNADASRRLIAFLSAAVLAGMSVLPVPTVAAELRCSSHSLKRDEIARAEAVARKAMPSVHLALTDACWNPDQELAELATPQVRTPEGVLQWWAFSCQRDESAWTCDPPEFKQLIEADLPVSDQPHLVELSFDRGISLERARILASRALSIYSDPATRLRLCGTIEESAAEPLTIHGTDKRTSDDASFHVKVTRDGLMDSVWLDDFDVKISFGASTNPADEQRPCWQSLVVVN